MTIDHSTATAAAAADLSPSERHGIFLYLGILIVLLAFGGPAGGLIDIPISFFLKNRLHLTAHEVATFRLDRRDPALSVLRVRIYPRYAGIRSG